MTHRVIEISVEQVSSTKSFTLNQYLAVGKTVHFRIVSPKFRDKTKPVDISAFVAMLDSWPLRSTTL